MAPAGLEAGGEVFVPCFLPSDPEKDDRKPRARVFARGQVPTRVLIPNIFTLLGLCAGLTAIRMAIGIAGSPLVAAAVFAAFSRYRLARSCCSRANLFPLDHRRSRRLRRGAGQHQVDRRLTIFDSNAGLPSVTAGGAARWAFRMAALDGDLHVDRRFRRQACRPGHAVALSLLPIYARISACTSAILTPLVLLYTLAVALLMVSRVPTFSGKLIGQKIAREYVLPAFVLVALFIACLLTYPSLTLAVGWVIYLALIPVSAYRYFQVEEDGAHCQGQNGRRFGDDGDRAAVLPALGVRVAFAKGPARR